MKSMYATIGTALLCLQSTSAFAPDAPMMLKVSPPQATIPNGDSIILNAKILDHLGIEQKRFDNDTNLDTCFKWTIISSIMGSHALVFMDSIGPQVTLSSKSAYQTVAIACAFHYGTVWLKDTVTVSVSPSYCNFRLYIEKDYDLNVSPNTPKPITGISFTSNNDTMRVYAVVRDEFGNYVSPARHAKWRTNLNRVAVNNGIDSLGEAVVYLDGAQADENGLLYCEDSAYNARDSAKIGVDFPSPVAWSVNRGGIQFKSENIRYYDMYGRKLPARTAQGVYFSNNNKRVIKYVAVLKNKHSQTSR